MLFRSDENLMELLFTISNLKDLGAKKVRVVIPYLGYARQERRFNDGEAVSAKIVTNLIESARYSPVHGSLWAEKLSPLTLEELFLPESDSIEPVHFPDKYFGRQLNVQQGFVLDIP